MSFILRLLARTALLTVGALLFFAVAPALIGWHVTTVMSDSMAPRLLRGDVVVSIPLAGDRVVPGQVALFHDPDHPGRLRMHRVIRVSPAHVLTTKGDANPQPDSTPVLPGTVLGVGVLRIPEVGYPVAWIRSGDLVQLGIFGAAFTGTLILALPARPDRERRPPKTRRTPGRRAAPARHRRARPWRLAGGVTLIVAIVSAAGVAGAAVATPSHSSFSSASTPPASTLAAANSFTCLTAAPQNPAYLYYRFGETSGASAADASGNERTATLHGGVAHVAGSCAAGHAPAITLDGSSGYLSTPTLETAPNTFTLSLWFKTTSTAGGKLIGFGSSQTGASAFYDRQLYLSNDGRLNFGVYPGLLTYDTITSTTSYNDGAWHQVTATLSSAGMAMYVDGALVAHNPSVTTGQLLVGYWRVGYDALSSWWPNSPTSPYYAGSLSDVAVYSTAFSAAQVATSFAAGR